MSGKLDQYIEEIQQIAAKHGVVSVSVFGSYARGQETPESDLDLLVQLDEESSLLDVVQMKLDLEDLMGVDVDIATSINRHFKEYVKDDLRKLV